MTLPAIVFVRLCSVIWRGRNYVRLCPPNVGERLNNWWIERCPKHRVPLTPSSHGYELGKQGPPILGLCCRGFGRVEFYDIAIGFGSDGCKTATHEPHQMDPN